MPEAVIEFFNTYGYTVVLLGAMADNLGIPSAGDIAILVGGVLAARGDFLLPLVIVLAILGAAIGDNGAYFVGKYGGHRLIRSERRLIRVPEALLHRGEEFFAKHGSKSVFLGRFVPGMRSMAPFFAGMNRMHYPVFFFANLAAVIIWGTVLGLIAFYFGSNWEAMMSVIGNVRNVLLIVIAIAIIGGLTYWLLKRRSRQNAS